MTSESGAIVERYEYDAYGEPRVFGGAAASGAEGFAPLHFSAAGNPYLHQGLRRDDESGLHENRCRSLHSRLGRFMQRDPLEYTDSFNLFELYRSRPLNGVDSDGRLSVFSGVWNILECGLDCYGCGDKVAEARQKSADCEAKLASCLDRAAEGSGYDEGFKAAECYDDRRKCSADGLEELAEAAPECAECLACIMGQTLKRGVRPPVEPPGPKRKEFPGVYRAEPPGPKNPNGDVPCYPK